METVAFARQLVQEGLIRAEQGERALAVHAAGATRLDTVLLHLGAIPEEALLAALGRHLRTRTVSAAELLDVAPEVLRLLPPRVARRYEVVPFRLDGRTLHLASLRPGDLLIEDEVGLLTGLRVTSFAALELRLYEALARHYDAVLPPALEALVRQLGRGEPAGAAETPAAPVSTPAAPPKRPAAPPPAPPVAPPRRPQAPGEVELSSEDLALFPSLSAMVPAASAPPPAPEPAAPAEAAPARVQTPEDHLAEAAVTLQSAEMREDVADALLGFAAAFFRRRMMLILRRDQVIGWRGEGEGMQTEIVRAIQIPVAEPSVFTGLVQGQGFWLGPLPRMPRNMDLVMGLGGTAPPDCVIVPIALRGKVIAFLYGDNMDVSVGGAPVGHLRRLAGKAALAFEIYILKSKLRML